MASAISRERVARNDTARFRVLVVDDDVVLRDTLVTLLGRHYDVVSASDGQTGIQALETYNDVAVVISDLKMPGMSGVEFLERARHLVPHSRRLVLSGHGDFEACLAATNRGQISRFLTKPTESESLMKAVREAVDEFKAELDVGAAAEPSIARLETSNHSEGLAMLGTMTSSIAHEMRNWTSALRGLLDGVAREELGNASISADEFADLDHVVAHLEEQTRAVLALARPRVSVRTRADLAVLVSGAVSLLVAAGATRRATVESIVSEAPLPISASAAQLEQVVLNLAKNALDAVRGRPGGRIVVSTSRCGDFAACRVADNGGGIPPDQIRCVFEPFFTTKPVGKGTGLGLHVAKGILDAHGGTIDVMRSSPDGTTIEFRVPLIDVPS